MVHNSTHHLESIVIALDLDLPDTGILVLLGIAELLDEFDNGMPSAGKGCKLGA